MVEMQDDIMVEDLGEYQQDPKPKLSESHKQKLDSIIVQMDKQGASREEILSIVEDYKKKYATKPLINQPVQKQPEPGREAAAVFGGEKTKASVAITGAAQGQMPVQVRDMVKKNKLIGEVKKSEAHIFDELSKNDAEYEKIIRQSRSDAVNWQTVKNDYRDKGYELPIGQEDELIKQYKKRAYDLPVTPEDISDAKTGVIVDEKHSRNLINKIDNKATKKAVYTLDAYRSLSGMPEKDEPRYTKIEENAKRIEKGELKYDTENGILFEPQGVVGSAITGWQQKSKGYDDFDFLINKSDQEIIDEYESRRNEYDPDRAIPVPKHKVAELTQMMGGMPLKSIAAMVAVSAVGAPEAAPTVGAVVGASDYYMLGYANAFNNVYNQLRDEGKSPQEALQMAKAQAVKEGGVDAFVGGTMNFFGGRIGMKRLSFSQGYKAALGDFVKGAGKEGGIQGLVGAGGEISKNLLAKAAGIKRDVGENVLNAIESNLLLTLGIGAIMNAGKGVSKIKYRTILNGLKKVPDNVLESHLISEVNAGRITEDQANNVREELKTYKELDSQIPENITEDARIQIQKKLEKKQELEAQLETLNKAFHPEIKEKIAKIDEEITELAKQKEPKTVLTDEQKELKLLIDRELSEGSVQGYMSDALKNTRAEDLPGIMKEIAEQANDPKSASMTRVTFGDAIVDKAIEMYPPQEKRVSVMMPDEVKKPDVVETKAVETEQKAEAQSDPNWTYGKREPEAPPVEQGPEMIGITHEQMDNVAKELNLPTYEGDPETVEGWDTEARARMQKDPEAITKLFTKLRNGGTPDAPETRMMIMYMADLKAKYNANPTPEGLNAIKRAKDLFNIVGREQGKAFRARQGEVPVEESLADFHMRDVDYNKGAPLTEQQMAQSTKEFEEISAAKTALEEKVAKLEEEKAVKKAEEAIKKEQSTVKKSDKKDYKSERKQIIDDIKEKLRKSRGDTTATILPYAKELIAIAPDVAKLVRNLVEEGIDKLPQIIKIVHNEIKEIIPQVTEKDVRDIIAGEYNEKKPKRSEINEKLANLRVQAKLINKLESLESGIQPKNEKQRVKRNQEIEDLRRKIKDMQDGGAADAQKLAAIKSRLKSEIAKLEEQLKNNDFDPEEKEPIELDEEAIKLKDQLNELRRQREYRLQKQEYEQQSLLKRVWDYWGRGILGLRRGVGTSIDFSVGFRQALPVTINPRYAKITARAFKEQFLQWADKKRYNRWWDDLHESGELKMMQDDELPLTPPDQLGVTKREEEFRARLVQDIPGLGKAVEMSNQASSGFLNTMRVDLYRKFSAMLEDKGITRKSDPEAYKRMAHYIGDLTGRGELLKQLKAGEGLLGDIFFGPKLMAAKFNLLNPKRYYDLPPHIRKNALYDVAIRAAMYTIIGALFKWSGWDISLDPNDPDFMKLQHGDTKYDMTGGEAVYIRTALRILNAARDRVMGNEKDSMKTASKASRSTLSFFRNKLAPNNAYLIDALTGKKATGEDFDPIDVLRVYPMWIDDIVDDWKQDGPASILTAGVPSIFGIGVQTYVPKEQKETGAKGSARPKKPKRPSRK